MILTDSDALALKKRLISKLEPMYDLNSYIRCDAEPSVLADYVIALLKHDKEDQELIDLCASQLQDFLKDHTSDFLKDLFNFLNKNKDVHYQRNDQHSRDDNKFSKRRREQKPYKRGVCRDYTEKGRCDRERCRYEHVDKKEKSLRGQEEDGYDPEDPGYVADKSKAQFRGGKGQRQSGPFRLKKDTLVVERIPQENCSLDSINEYFKKFGNILNVSIDKNQFKAVIQYERVSDAQSAHSCPDSIFGNRFVKAFFLREYDENGVRSTNGLDSQNGAVPLGAPYMQNIEPLKAPQQVFYEKGKQLIELQKNQEAIISQQIEASRMLMSQLASPNISSNEKKVLMEQLKVLQGSTQSLVEKASEHTRMLKLQTSSSQEDLERQRLDRELDVLNQMAAASDEATDQVDPALKSKLEALKAEANALGIPGYSSRGRGRGGKFPRGGRGARSLRLDNRSRKLIVTGNSDIFLNALNEHCQSLAGIESITPQNDKSAIISFFSRFEAEAAVVKPIKVEGLEGVTVQWVPSDISSNPPSAIPISANPETVNSSNQNWEEEEDGDVSWKRR